MRTWCALLAGVIGACAGACTILLPPPAGAQESPATVQVETAVICRDVVDLSPQQPADRFESTVRRLYCFSRVVGAMEHTEILHTWFCNGDMVASIVLPVKSVSWRTFSSKTIQPDDIGDWSVRILSKDGAILSKIDFTVY